MTGFLTNPGAGYVFAAIGFFACFISLRLFRFGATGSAVRVSHAGSRMMYLVWHAAILALLSVATWLTYVVSIDVFATTSAIRWIVFALSFLAGGLLGLASLLRAKDAGVPPFAALCGIIPLANLWLMVAAPDPALDRERYVPEGSAARILVSLAALAIIVAAGFANDFVTQQFTAKVISQTASRGIVAKLASLPETLARSSTLSTVDVNSAQKSIYYVYDVVDETQERTRIDTWLEETMKPEALKTLCNNVLVTERGWFVGFQYLDAASNVITSTSLTNRDCGGQSG